jgi:hypothetical protein
MKRPVIIAVFAVFAGAGIFLLLRPSNPVPVAPVILMTPPYRIPAQHLSLFERYVPRRASWGWLWRLEETVMGRPRVCEFTATVVDVTGAGDSFLTNRPLPAPTLTATNGLRVWLLGEADLKALGLTLNKASGTEVLCIPRIMTASGRQAQLVSGSLLSGLPTPGVAGLTVDLFPKVRRDATDLTVIMRLTEALTNQTGGASGSSAAPVVSLQTNFDLTARIQVPKASGVFILDSPPAAVKRKRIGVILSVNLPAPKK